MWYLRVIDNRNFGFVKDGMHDILETDIHITEKEYNDFFELHSKGVQFKVLDIKQTELFKILTTK